MATFRQTFVRTDRKELSCPNTNRPQRTILENTVSIILRVFRMAVVQIVGFLALERLGAVTPQPR